MLETSYSQLTPDTLDLFSDKTRDVILESSLVIFNERGFNGVTTSSIADTASILEGSLWYHFNSKKDILSAHILLLEQVFLGTNQNVESKNSNTIVQGIFKCYNLIWDFRYILRDNFQALLKEDPVVMNLVTQINTHIDEWVENRIRHSNNVGLLKVPREDIENLSEVILVLGRYWLDFSEKKYPGAYNESLRSKGLYHIFLVLRPYINPKEIRMIEDMLNQY